MHRTNNKNTMGTSRQLCRISIALISIIQSCAPDAIPNLSSDIIDADIYHRYSAHDNNASDSGRDPESGSVFILLGRNHSTSRRNSRVSGGASIYGFRVEKSSKPVDYDGSVASIMADSTVTIRLFGEQFTSQTMLKFVTVGQLKGSNCDDVPSTRSFEVDPESLAPHSLTADIQLPPLGVNDKEYYICTKERSGNTSWIHQGQEKWITVTSYKKWLPLWAHILLLSTLLILSGLFSGLNLGLMAMDRTELKIVERSGSVEEKSYAKKIKPLRNRGNYLLCSLLLGNVLVNSTLTILLDDLTTGLVAVVASTMGIVIFGEIIPQAFCSRHGLAVGAHTVWLTKITMLITFPLSFPISMLLDKILGEEIGNVYNRERLRELLKVTEQYNELKKDEMNVIEGVLRLSQCTCGDVMTKLDTVFMLSLNAMLDFETIDEIIKSGFSRIPIYDGTRTNIVSILYTKDLAFVDPDDKMPLKSVCEFYQHPCNFVDEKKPLDTMFKEFKEGDKGHMAFVQHFHISENCDPYYEVIGVITIEDVIEELIQAEIEDESDVRISRARDRKTKDLPKEIFKFHGAKQDEIIVSPQLSLACCQFLSTSIDEFGSKFISPNILKKLLERNVYFKIKLKLVLNSDVKESIYIYERGKPVDYFILLLEGKVQAFMGKESLLFEAGPFTYFGTQCLTPSIGTPTSTPIPDRKLSGLKPTTVQASFTPDYTVKAATDITYLQISRSAYLSAIQATTLERCLTETKTSSELNPINPTSGGNLGQVGTNECNKLDTPSETETSLTEGTCVTTSEELNHDDSVHKGPNKEAKNNLEANNVSDSMVKNQETFVTIDSPLYSNFIDDAS